MASSNRVTLEVKGLRDLDHALRLMLPTMERERVILRALHDGARPITAEARRRAPVLQERGVGAAQPPTNRGGRVDRARPIRGIRWRVPGALRSAITQHADRHNYSTVLVRVRSKGYLFEAGARSRDFADNPSWWWLVEFGTSKMKPQPFLYPAFEAKKEEATRAIQLSLLRGVFAVGKSLGFDVKDWTEG